MMNPNEVSLMNENLRKYKLKKTEMISENTWDLDNTECATIQGFIENLESILSE